MEQQMDIDNLKIISPYQEEAQEILKSTFIEYGQNLEQHIEKLSNIYYIDTDYVNKKYSNFLILAIGEASKDISSKIDQYYQDIILIGKLETNTVQKWNILQILKKSLMNYINKHQFEINFKYSDSVLRDLNDIIDYNYPWMDNNPILVLQIALEAHRDIEYFYMWTKRHKYTKKNFITKRNTLLNKIKSLQEYTNIPVDIKIPDRPQDIRYKLERRYWDYFGEELSLSDDGVNNIFNIISNNMKNPGKSKEWKEQEDFASQFHVNTNKIPKKDFFDKLKKMVEKKTPDNEVKKFISEFTYTTLEMTFAKS